MAERKKTKVITQNKNGSKKLFPSEKENLQSSVAMFFGNNIEEVRESTSAIRTKMLQLAGAGALGSIVFYYLLIFHTT
jgi:hypothetical protein